MAKLDRTKVVALFDVPIYTWSTAFGKYTFIKHERIGYKFETYEDAVTFCTSMKLKLLSESITDTTKDPRYILCDRAVHKFTKRNEYGLVIRSQIWTPLDIIPVAIRETKYQNNKTIYTTVHKFEGY